MYCSSHCMWITLTSPSYPTIYPYITSSGRVLFRGNILQVLYVRWTFSWCSASKRKAPRFLYGTFALGVWGTSSLPGCPECWYVFFTGYFV